MVALGLLLLLASGVLTAALVMDNTDAVSVSVFGETISGLTQGGLFIAGVVTGAAAILGLTMMMAGAARGRRRRAVRKQQVLAARDEKETLAEENMRLKRELDASRSDDAVYPADETDGRHVDTTTDERHGLFHR
ncbi:MAG: hypothetical protein JJD92_02320 [Frankiaceae bacterium]|nr:hypothetical protein [Frankiaceae bacterium]